MTHVDDGAMVRFLDGECDAEERDVVAGHLETCGECTERLGRLDRYSRTVSVLLRQADLPRGRPRWTRWLRAAAAVVVLLGVAGGISPVRAWILDQTQAIWMAVTGRVAEVVETPQAPEQDDETASVRFVPAGGPFLVEIASGQSQGSLVVETTDDVTASARVRGGTGTEHLVVMPNGLKIENDLASKASYRIRLPATLADVTVVIGAAAVHPLSPLDAGQRWEVDLRSDTTGPVGSPRGESLER